MKFYIYILLLSSILSANFTCQKTLDVQHFVQRFYVEVLEREAEDEGLDYWTNQLTLGRLSGADVAYGFIFSDEFINKNKDDNAFLTILYKSFFNRKADRTGFNYWKRLLQEGRSRVEILEGFLHSQEFIKLAHDYGIQPYEKISINIHKLTLFVKRFYTVILGREAEKEGLNYWVKRLYSGQATGEDIAQGFIFSHEFQKSKQTNENFITTLYRAFLNREPDTHGFEYWKRSLQEGKSKVEVLKGFLHSQEFILLSNKYGIQAFKGAVKIEAFTSVPPIIVIKGRQSYTEHHNVLLSGINSTDSDGSIECYIWQDKNKLLSTESIFRSSNFSEGKHTIRFTVVDDDGLSSSKSTVVHIIEKEPIALNISDKLTTIGFPDGGTILTAKLNPYNENEGLISGDMGDFGLIQYNASTQQYSIKSIGDAEVETKNGVIERYSKVRYTTESVWIKDPTDNNRTWCIVSNGRGLLRTEIKDNEENYKKWKTVISYYNHVTHFVKDPSKSCHIVGSLATSLISKKSVRSKADKYTSGILESVDCGKSWERIDVNANHTYYDVEYLPNGDLLLGGYSLDGMMYREATAEKNDFQHIDITLHSVVDDEGFKIDGRRISDIESIGDKIYIWVVPILDSDKNLKNDFGLYEVAINYQNMTASGVKIDNERGLDYIFKMHPLKSVLDDNYITELRGHALMTTYKDKLYISLGNGVYTFDKESRRVIPFAIGASAAGQDKVHKYDNNFESYKIQRLGSHISANTRFGSISTMAGTAQGVSSFSVTPSGKLFLGSISQGMYLDINKKIEDENVKIRNIASSFEEQHTARTAKVRYFYDENYDSSRVPTRFEDYDVNKDGKNLYNHYISTRGDFGNLVFRDVVYYDELDENGNFRVVGALADFYFATIDVSEDGSNKINFMPKVAETGMKYTNISWYASPNKDTIDKDIGWFKPYGNRNGALTKDNKGNLYYGMRAKTQDDILVTAVLKSIDRGASWIPSLVIPVDIQKTNIAADYIVTDEEYVYAMFGYRLNSENRGRNGGAEITVMVSKDRGNTWAKDSAGLQIDQNESISGAKMLGTSLTKSGEWLILGTRFGLYKKKIRTDTPWEKIPYFSTENNNDDLIGRVVADPYDNNVIYISHVKNGKYIRYENQNIASYSVYLGVCSLGVDREWNIEHNISKNVTVYNVKDNSFDTILSVNAESSRALKTFVWQPTRVIPDPAKGKLYLFAPVEGKFYIYDTGSKEFDRDGENNIKAYNAMASSIGYLDYIENKPIVLTSFGIREFKP